MGLEFLYEDGQTPLSEEEKEGLLIKTITIHGELDEYEQLNIEKAIQWLMRQKLKKKSILTEKFIKALHKKCWVKFGVGQANLEGQKKTLEYHG